MPMRAGSTSGWASRTSRAAGQVPQVLGQRAEPRHHGVDEVGVAGVVVVGVPVEALAEAPQVGGEHDVAPPGQLVRVVGVGRARALEPARLGLARPVAVDGEHRRTRLPRGRAGTRR